LAPFSRRFQVLFPAWVTSVERHRVTFAKHRSSIVAELCEQGINPSRKHVIAAIVDPSMLCSHILDQQIARTLRELGAESRISLSSSVSG